ncbi:hypothetical protein ACNFCJ_08030 [Pseudomonas sp. NY15364]|uniref:hypothetical protein n=1 Tax=Pseudomonas sp. NY15364 TaxID=3400353 RepID=UPI003A83E3FE
MTKHFTIVALLAFSGLAQAGNYATCLLDKLPGVQNHGASVSAVRVCQSKYPGGLAGVEQGAGRGLFASYDSGDECTYDKAKDTRYTGAVRVMAEACMRLYNKPQPPAPKQGLFDDLIPGKQAR